MKYKYPIFIKMYSSFIATPSISISLSLSFLVYALFVVVFSLWLFLLVFFFLFPHLLLPLLLLLLCCCSYSFAFHVALLHLISTHTHTDVDVDSDCDWGEDFSWYWPLGIRFCWGCAGKRGQGSGRRGVCSGHRWAAGFGLLLLPSPVARFICCCCCASSAAASASSSSCSSSSCSLVASSFAHSVFVFSGITLHTTFVLQQKSKHCTAVRCLATPLAATSAHLQHTHQLQQQWRILLRGFTRWMQFVYSLGRGLKRGEGIHTYVE